MADARVAEPTEAAEPPKAAEPTEAAEPSDAAEAAEAEVGEAAEQPATPAKHTDVRQARFWRTAVGVLPSWLVPSELAEQPAIAIDKLFVERLALE